MRWRKPASSSLAWNNITCYLPMTEVRQLVYDADRLYYLNQKDQARQKLRLAKAVLARIEKNRGEPTAETTRKMASRLGELLDTMHSDSAEVPSQLKVLGEKTNLMALKGKLVLAGSTLSAQKPQP